MNHLKNWAIALLGVLALSITDIGCGAQDDGYDDELGTVQQGLEYQLAGGINTNQYMNGFLAGVSPENPSCITSAGSTTTCVVPPDKSVTFSGVQGASQAVLNNIDLILGQMNSSSTGLGGSGWSLTRTNCATQGCDILVQEGTVTSSAGNDNIARYSHTTCTLGSTLTESVNVPGIVRVYTGCTVTIDPVRIASRCAAIGGLCNAVLTRHAMAHGMLLGVGQGATIVIGTPGTATATDDTASSYDILPLFSTGGDKAMFSSGGRCRARRLSTASPGQWFLRTISTECADNN